MAELSRFFNSEVGDVREYQASEFAEYFAKFLSDGIYVEDGQMGLNVTAGTGLAVNIAVGSAYIRGYLYKNDATLNKTLTVADATLNRIDRVVLQFDEVNKWIKIIIKSGGYASSPSPPSLTDTTTTKELSLAQVRVNAASTTPIITDERMTETGQVQLLIDAPLEDILVEWNAWLLDKENVLDNLIDASDVTTLTNLINTKMDETKIHLSATDAVVGDMADGDIWIKYI